MNRRIMRLFFPYMLLLCCLFPAGAIAKPKQSQGDRAMSMEKPPILPKPSTRNAEHYALPEQCNDIFSIPVKNAVGTLAMHNAFSALQFEDGEIRVKHIKTNFLPNVYTGDLSYLPVFSESLFGYTQTRGFELINIENTHFKELMITYSLDKSIVRGIAVNPLKNIFAFEILELYEAVGHIGRKRSIIIADCSGDEESKELSIINPGNDRRKLPWAFQKGVFFIYDKEAGTLKTYDANGKPIPHPLAALIEENRKKLRDVVQLYVHPHLPFALIVDFANTQREPVYLWVAKWGPDKPALAPILGVLEPVDGSHFEFSPDGRYVAFWHKEFDEAINDERIKFFALAISPEAPWYISRWFHLSDGAGQRFRPESGAWTRDPQAYVVSDGAILYRWELK